jgi:hypothetical protein
MSQMSINKKLMLSDYLLAWFFQYLRELEIFMYARPCSTGLIVGWSL